MERCDNMNSMKFSSLEELYNKLIPAMDTKVNELRLNGISYINIDDIWNYNKSNNWVKSKDLTLSQCVNDILNTSDDKYKKYVKDKMISKLSGGN